MEGVRAQDVLWRAVQSPKIVSSAYAAIITTEAAIALLCWSSALAMLWKRKGKTLASAELTIAFGLFMFGFVVIADEWPYMWQHPILSGMQQKAAVIALIILGCLFIVAQQEG